MVKIWLRLWWFSDDQDDSSDVQGIQMLIMIVEIFIDKDVDREGDVQVTMMLLLKMMFSDNDFYVGGDV